MIQLSSILSCLALFVIPIFVGRAVWMILKKRTSISFPWLTYFILGSLTIFGWALISQYLLLKLFPGSNFVFLLKGGVFGCFLLSLGINGKFWRKNFRFRLRNSPWEIVWFLGLAALIFGLWRWRSPYPLNWDFLEHQALVNTILKGRYSFVTSRISDTFIFNGYSSFFHTLLATVQAIFPPKVLDFWLAISFCHLFLVILASWIFAEQISQDKTIAFFSSLLGGLIFESVTFTSLFFMPQTFTAVIFIFLFTQMIRGAQAENLPPSWLLGISCLFLFLIHYVIGFLAALILAGTYLYITLRDHPAAKIGFGLLKIMVILLLILGLVSPLINLNFLNQGEAKFYNFNLAKKLFLFQRAYGLSLIVFVPLGIKEILSRRKKEEFLVIVIGGIIFILVLTNLPYMFKFYVLGRFFIHLVMAVGMGALVSRLNSRSLRMLGMSFLAVTFGLIFTTNTIYWKEILYYQSLLTHLSGNEVKAAEFLINKYGQKSVLLLSDPATQGIFEAISGFNTQGGVYANLSTRKEVDIKTFFENPDLFSRELNGVYDRFEVNPTNRFLILSGRYFLWAKRPIEEKNALYFNLWTPADLTFEDYKVGYQMVTSRPDLFELIYLNPTLMILKVKSSFTL